MTTYPDESHLTGVWRVLRASEFEDWLKAQTIKKQRRYIVDHHTWSPNYNPQDPGKFLAQIKSIFRNYYEVPISKGGRGWPRDHGPHLFVGVIDDEPWVVIAANMHVNGPQCANWNTTSIGIETVWNGDKAPWHEPILTGLAHIHRAFERVYGIPLESAALKGVNQCTPANSKNMGYIFHRDALNSNKSCPGNKNTHQLLQAALDAEEDMAVRHVAPSTYKPELEKLVRAGIITKKELYDEPGEVSDAAGLDWVITVIGRVAEKAGIVPKS
uniref:Putative N-acetylmuramoyl-L-alanine amidase n=1 Tax=viral metagenome TaxID=1070528 RepID=A0A6M3JFY1_9ZZZZ